MQQGLLTCVRVGDEFLVVVIVIEGVRGEGVIMCQACVCVRVVPSNISYVSHSKITCQTHGVASLA